jgi:hypothetical protein
VKTFSGVFGKTLFSSSGIMPPHLIFSYARREEDQGDKKHKERVEVRGHFLSRVKGIGTRVQRQGRSVCVNECLSV